MDSWPSEYMTLRCNCPDSHPKNYCFLEFGSLERCLSKYEWSVLKPHNGCTRQKSQTMYVQKSTACCQSCGFDSGSGPQVNIGVVIAHTMGSIRAPVLRFPEWDTGPWHILTMSNFSWNRLHCILSEHKYSVHAKLSKEQ